MRTLDALIDLLACALEQLETPVCRSFINPGPNAPHDVCESNGEHNGQLWVANLDSVAGWPTQSTLPITCAVPYADQVEVGIVRCAQSVLEGVNLIPDAELVTADATQQQDDKDALKRAILCCWAVDGRDLLAPIWEPITPQGGCVGGIWTITIRDASCSCPAES
jgi:hypothetical protein